MDVFEFYEKLKARCGAMIARNGEGRCDLCGMRIFCFTAPLSMTEDMVRQVINYLENDQAEKRIATNSDCRMSQFQNLEK